MDRILKILDAIHDWGAGRISLIVGIIFLLIGITGGAGIFAAAEGRLDYAFWSGGVLTGIGLFFEFYKARRTRGN